MATTMSIDDAVPQTFEKTKVQMCNCGSFTMAKIVAAPGWKWSECIKPIVGTEWCEKTHNGTLLSGSVCVKMSDGTETIIKAGDCYSIPPGHDGWVLGDEEAVMMEYSAVWDKDLNPPKK